MCTRRLCSRRSVAALLVPLAAAIAAGAGAGCSTTEPLPSQPAYCEPLSGDSCPLPWPSSFYLTADSKTATGFRLNYPAEVLPKNLHDVAIRTDHFDRLDGFSIGSQPIFYFSAGVREDDLPKRTDFGASLSADSSVRILDYDSGEAVPLFAELDDGAQGHDVPAVVVRPQVPLSYDKRYVVIVRHGLHDASGQLLAPPEPFRRLRDGEAVDDQAVSAQADRVKEVVAFAEQHGVPREEILLAWDFHTASDSGTTGPLLAMVDEALNKVGQSGPKYSIVKVTDYNATDEPKLLRLIEGKMSVPSFLRSDGPDALLNRDATTGKVSYRADQWFPFYAIVPRCATKATGVLPVLIHGHGLFGDPKKTLLSSYHKMVSERFCMVEFAIHWLGLSNLDLTAVLTKVLLDFNNLPRVTDRLQQAQVNQTALVRLLRGGLPSDKALALSGRPLIDGKEIYYFGISNGGIQGITFSALDPDLVRFGLVVPGGWWSVLIAKSSDFSTLGEGLQTVYPDAIERLWLINLSQHMWDAVDPIAYANRVLRAPFPGRKKKRVLIAEAVGDPVVPNLATRAVVRAMHIPALAPQVGPVYGLKAEAGPHDSAYVQYRLKPTDKPTDIYDPVPPKDKTKSPHVKLQSVETLLKQLQLFFKPDGRVQQTCDGPCDPL